MDETSKKNSDEESKKKRLKKLTPYEEGLYTFLKKKIYASGARWSDIVYGLKEYGFSHKSATGTDVFSVNEKNELFYEDHHYKGKFFNVHSPRKDKNAPLNSDYRAFFETGFGNVFGLTEDFITEALDEHQKALEQEKENKKN